MMIYMKSLVVIGLSVSEETKQNMPSVFTMALLGKFTRFKGGFLSQHAVKLHEHKKIAGGLMVLLLQDLHHYVGGNVEKYIGAQNPIRYVNC